ncbi:MAG TPA: hypothetical protein VGJ63_16175 [Micromonosporaceae bacterium]|jgi:hypothetical protein
MSAQPRRGLTEPTPLPVRVPASGPRANPERTPGRVLPAIALASIAAGAINAAAAATVGRDSAENLAFFVAVAAAQLIWGAVALARAPRWWLALGAVGNLVVVTTWVVSRTVGLPVGEYAGIRLPVGFPDALATALEAVTVVGAAVLLVRGWGPARSPARSPAVTMAVAVVVGALALVGVLAQLGAIGSSPAGPDRDGGGGVSGPSGGGDGSSGGGSSGGGYSGGGY